MIKCNLTLDAKAKQFVENLFLTFSFVKIFFFRVSATVECNYAVLDSVVTGDTEIPT